MYEKVNKTVNTLSAILLKIGVVCMATATILCFLQTVLRYVFGINIVWIEEVFRYLIIFTSFSLCGHVTFHNGHVSLSIIYDNIKSVKAKKIVDIINASLSGVFGCILFVFAWNTLINSKGQMTMTQSFPMALPYSLLPIGMALLVVFAVLKICSLVLEKDESHQESESVSQEEALK